MLLIRGVDQGLGRAGLGRRRSHQAWTTTRREMHRQQARVRNRTCPLFTLGICPNRDARHASMCLTSTFALILLMRECCVCIHKTDGPASGGPGGAAQSPATTAHSNCPHGALPRRARTLHPAPAAGTRAARVRMRARRPPCGSGRRGAWRRRRSNHSRRWGGAGGGVAGSACGESAAGARGAHITCASRACHITCASRARITCGVRRAAVAGGTPGEGAAAIARGSGAARGCGGGGLRAGGGAAHAREAPPPKARSGAGLGGRARHLHWQHSLPWPRGGCRARGIRSWRPRE